MQVYESMSQQAFRGRRVIQFHPGKDRAELVELVTFLFHESSKAEHVHKQNECRLEWLRHQFSRSKVSARATPFFSEGLVDDSLKA